MEEVQCQFRHLVGVLPEVSFFDQKFYFEFFYTRLNELDQLSLWKRIKILIRYFVYGKREI